MSNLDIKSLLSNLAPAAGLIPGAGLPISMGMGLASALIPSPTLYKPVAENTSLSKGGRLKKYSDGGLIKQLLDAVKKANPGIDDTTASQIATSTYQSAYENNLNPFDLLAQAGHESMRFDSRVLSGALNSPAGAKGIAQFMDPTARRYNVDVRDINSSMMGMGKYMSDILNKNKKEGYGTDIAKAQQRYNAGGPRFKDFMSGKSIEETENYPRKVEALKAQMFDNPQFDGFTYLATDPTATVTAPRPLPQQAEIQRDNTRIDRPALDRMAYGGSISNLSNLTQEVKADNPSMIDSVELPSARVDHNETITQVSPVEAYVFSNKLTDPASGKTFAKYNKMLASSDKKAEAKPYDSEAKKTLEYNSKLRNDLMERNEVLKLIANISSNRGLANGGKMKYNSGGPLDVQPIMPGYKKNFFSFLENQPASIVNPYLKSMTPNSFEIPPVTTGEDFSKLSEVRDIAMNTPTPQPTTPSPSKFDLKSLLDNPMSYQFGELASKAALLARGYDKQPYRVSGSPISLQQMDPSSARLQNQYALNKARTDISESPTASSYMAGVQNVYGNLSRADAQISSAYDNANREARLEYENRLAARDAQNIQSRFITDQIRQQDEAAYFNQLYDILTSVGNIGKAKASKKSNEEAVQNLISAFPDIASFFKLS